MNKIEIFKLGFLEFDTGKRNLYSRFSNSIARDAVHKLSAFVRFAFHGAASIPYIQAAILNLPHPQLRSTTVLLDEATPLSEATSYTKPYQKHTAKRQ